MIFTSGQSRRIRRTYIFVPDEPNKICTKHHRETIPRNYALIFGLTVDLMPEAFEGVHPWISPIFSSSLSSGTITAIVLNLIFRIGIAKKVKLELTPEIDSFEKIFDFMEKNGSTWGARKEVISKAVGAMNEFFEAVVEHRLTKEKIDMDVSFDEFNLDIDVHYRGKPIEFPLQGPDVSKVLEQKTEQLKLSGFLMRKYSDTITGSTKDGVTHIHMHFDH